MSLLLMALCLLTVCHVGNHFLCVFPASALLCAALNCVASYIHTNILGNANNTWLNPGEYVVCACLHVDVG